MPLPPCHCRLATVLCNVHHLLPAAYYLLLPTCYLLRGFTLARPSRCAPLHPIRTLTLTHPYTLPTVKVGQKKRYGVIEVGEPGEPGEADGGGASEAAGAAGAASVAIGVPSEALQARPGARRDDALPEGAQLQPTSKS